MTEPAKAAVAPPAYRREDIFTTLGSRQSWAILYYMVTGDGHVTAGEIAGVLGGISNSAALKQLDRLVRAGILVRGNTRIYKMRAGLQPNRDVPHLDFGHALIRLDHPDPE